MNLYLKQKVFSWGDRFTIYDENGNDRFYVQGEIFTFGKKLHIYDTEERELAFIRQKLMSFLPQYKIFRGEQEIAHVTRQFTFFHPKYVVEGLDWTVTGDYFAHEYQITAQDQPIVSVSKKWISWGDTYEIRINPNIDAVNALAVVLIIDACLNDDNQSAAFTAGT